MIGKKSITLIILSLMFILTSNKILLSMSCCSINPIRINFIPKSPLENVIDLAFSPNGCLAVLDDSSVLRVFTPLASCMYDPIPTVTFPAQPSTANAIAISVTGCIAIANENEIPIYIPSDTCPGCDYSAIASTVIPTGGTAIGFSFNNCLASGNDNGEVFIYRAIDPVTCNYDTAAITNFSVPSAAHISSISFSPINNCLAIGENDGNVYIYSNVNGCTYNTIPNQTIALGSAINSVIFSNAGCLAIADNSGRVTIYQSGADCTYTLTTTISGLSVPSVATFSPGGCLAIGNRNGNVGIYSSTGPCTYNTSPMSSLASDIPVSAIAFSLGNCLAVPFAESINIYGFRPAINVAIAPQDSVVCPGGTITLTATATGGTGSFIYTWISPSGTIIQTGPSNTLAIANVTAADMGSYTVRVQDTNGCTASAMAFVEVGTFTILLTNPICSLSSNPQPTITGMTSPNISIIIFANGTEIGRTISNALGQFAFSPQIPLANGRYTITAATLTNPCIATSNSIVIVIDTLNRNCLSLAIRNKYCPAC